jgi:Sulfotransferase family
MIISHNKKFVMLEPWKTASQTMRARLHEHSECESRYPGFFYFNPYLNRVVHQHITRAEFDCLPEAKLGYLTAAFVRNPYDRVYSGFRQLQKDIQEQPSARFPEPWIRDLVRKQLAENFAQLCQAGFEFDSWLALIGEEQVYGVGRNSNFPLHPSHYWTHVADVRATDFIGRVETFEMDFSRFLSEVGIQLEELVNENVVDLKGDSDANPFGYRYVSRMNTRSKAKINELFAKDFEIFGYERIN